MGSHLNDSTRASRILLGGPHGIRNPRWHLPLLYPLGYTASRKATARMRNTKH